MKYSDILNLKYTKSGSRPHMTAHDRASQFAPFAALGGLDERMNEAEASARKNYDN